MENHSLYGMENLKCELESLRNKNELLEDSVNQWKHKVNEYQRKVAQEKARNHALSGAYEKAIDKSEHFQRCAALMHFLISVRIFNSVANYASIKEDSKEYKQLDVAGHELLFNQFASEYRTSKSYLPLCF